MKKGLMQLQTIIYVIFAVVILMVGMFSIQNYMTRMDVTMNYELSSLDMTVLGKRIIGSDKCFVELEKISLVSKVTGETYSILESDQGKLDKNKITTKIVNDCFFGFDKNDYNIKFYDLGLDEPFHKWGDANCESDIDLLVRFGDEFGLVEVCARE